jgi:hypothetical protein
MLLPYLHRSRAMAPLEQLFRLEIEFHRRLRTQAPGTADARALHTSYALQAGYERLIRATGPVTAQDLDQLTTLTLAGNIRDILAARDSLRQLLGIA